MLGLFPVTMWLIGLAGETAVSVWGAAGRLPSASLSKGDFR
jgi:hypothetical protein